MELNWSTFFLEIVNFLILMWILNYFLYRPVMTALEKRRATIETSLQEASDKMEQAETLQAQYQKRLSEWAHEKQQLKAQLEQSLQQEREDQLKQLKDELYAEREKEEVIARQSLAETQSSYQRIAHEQGGKFAAKLLSSIAGPESELRLFDLLIEKIEGLSTENIAILQNACHSAPDKISVASAYPLPSKQSKQLEAKFSELCGKAVRIKFHQTPELIAGLRIHIGAWSVRMNLFDELNHFMELSHDNG